jgi:bifunctional DNase/RNase
MENFMNEYMKVSGFNIAEDKEQNMYLLLQTESDKEVVIHIGGTEAFSIVNLLQNKKFERPLTHDLIKNLLSVFNHEVDKVLITKVDEHGTFYSIMRLTNKDKDNIIDIDCRPSDSISLALRFKAPIYISKKLL